MAGLGLSDFLNHNPREQHRGSGRGDFLPDWKKPPKGKTSAETVIWLHTAAQIYYANRHSFIRETEYEDKEKKGEKKKGLTFPKFISPDPVAIHVNQYFREDDDRMQQPPDRDPFLILREWLRVKGRTGLISPEAAVFEWTDYGNNNLPIRWLLKHLSKMEKTGKANFTHTLDSKESYLFTVVPDANPSGGAKLTWETKLVGEKMGTIISQEKKSKGDVEGDPSQWPYAFCWEFHKDASFDKAYTIYRFDKSPFTPAIEAAVYAEAFPDGSKHATFQEADLKQMREDFEAAMVLDLPLDLIFSTEKEDRLAAVRGEGGEGSKPRTQARPAPAAQAQQRPAVAAGAPGRRPTVGAAGAAPAGQQAQGARQAAPATRTAAPAPSPPPAQPAAATGGGRTRRAVSAAPPPPPPAEDTIPCETCKKDMPLTALECPHCHQKYEPIEESADAGEAPEQQASGDAKKCIYCNGRTGPASSGAGTVCIEKACGMDQGDDIPF